MDINHQDKYEKVGLNIAYYRRSNKLTQEALAELLDLDRTHISNVELGKGGVSLDVIFDMADLFKIPVYKLFEFRD